jgi:hypothetical protein
MLESILAVLWVVFFEVMPCAVVAAWLACVVIALGCAIKSRPSPPSPHDWVE